MGKHLMGIFHLFMHIAYGSYRRVGSPTMLVARDPIETERPSLLASYVLVADAWQAQFYFLLEDFMSHPPISFQ